VKPDEGKRLKQNERLCIEMKDVQKFVRRGILEIEPYVPGKPIEEVQEELGLLEIIKLASNENPLGPSPRVLAAMEKELKYTNLYPEGSCAKLRKKISQRLGIDEDMITISNGADNCIHLITTSFVNEGDEVLMADPTFAVYKTATKLMGGRPSFVGLRDHVHDLEAMQEKIGPQTKLIFVCNPNNPTGSIVRKNELDTFINHLSENIILIIDEAYYEFVTDEGYPDSLDYIREGYNVISLRSFSKLYGIAGLRVGYALGCKELIDVINRVREPFPVSRVAQAGAFAVLEDNEFKEQVLTINEAGKAYFYDEFKKMGLQYVPSNTNFIFVDLGVDTKEVFESLLREGIIIRPGHLWDCSTFARITIGTMEQNRRCIDALRKVLG